MPLYCPARRALLAGGTALIAWPTAGFAHAVLEDSDPKAGSSVPAGSTLLRLMFNSRIDRLRSRLTVSGPGGKQITPTIEPDGPPEILSATITLTPGAWTIRWQVLAIDGHITRGDVPFTVTGR